MQIVTQSLQVSPMVNPLIDVRQAQADEYTHPSPELTARMKAKTLAERRAFTLETGVRVDDQGFMLLPGRGDSH
jgi:hypothetical protein